MGAGTNVQDRLIALHHLDVPWRPSDIEQQEGRILRQGNLNPKVKIFRYVTEYIRFVQLAAHREQAEIHRADYDEQIPGA